MFCVDILNTVSGGDTYAVNVTSLANGADLSTRATLHAHAVREAAFF